MAKLSPAEIQMLKERVPLSEVVGRGVIWDMRKSNPRKRDWWGCCPAHGESNPSFHVDDRRGLMKCFSCGWGGDHLTYLTDIEGLRFSEAVQELAKLAGVELEQHTPRPVSPEEAEERRRREEATVQAYQVRRAFQEAEKAREEEDSRQGAFAVWKRAQPISGTLGEGYLRLRGYDGDLSRYPSLRFIADLRWKGAPHPAVVCAVTGPDGKFRGVWRIFIAPGNPRALAKMGLGRCGGGAVWLGKPASRINSCEGLETGLAIRRILCGAEPVAVCLSTSGLTGFEPPPMVRSVLCWPDGDEPGYKAATEHVGKMRARGLLSDQQYIPLSGDDFADILEDTREVVDRGPTVIWREDGEARH